MTKMTKEKRDKIRCPVCNGEYEYITLQHIRKHGYDSSDDFKTAFGLPFLRSASLRQNHSAFMRSSGNPTTGGHSKESIERMRLNRKGKGIGVCGKYIRTTKIREEIARGVAKAHIENRLHGLGRGSYISTDKAGRVWVRSSWEARVARILDVHPDVLTFEVEPYSIPYTIRGVEHRYIPDFLVTFECGIEELWEVKPEALLDLEVNREKLLALNEFVSNQPGLNGRLVTLADIERMEMQVKQLLCDNEP